MLLLPNQDPCIGNDLAPGQYPAYDSGNAKNVWITESDCVTPAVGKVIRQREEKQTLKMYINHEA